MQNSAYADDSSSSENPTATLDTITITAKKNENLSPTSVFSSDDIYDNNESSTYKDKETIERFMGESPSDIFKGMIGVSSGDSRNSGAIDPNVRGIQGQGRVPVSIDGTEQAVTVYRGYAGANNRNYIDPLLIGDIKVTKGSSMERGVQSSVGGAVTINTLNVDDVLTDGQDFGVSIKAVTTNNTTKANALDYDSNSTVYAGDYGFDVYPVEDMYVPERQKTEIAKKQAEERRDKFLNLTGDLPRRTVGSIASKLPDRQSDPLSFEDKAVRFAAAGRGEIAGSVKVDGLFAYTRRERGNYYAGKHNDDDYSSNIPRGDRTTGDFSAYMSDVYQSGAEVPNTSNSSSSYLLKGTVRPNDDQAIQLGIRHTETTYGDIMPSRVTGDDFEGSLYNQTGRLPQWPLSNVEIDSQYLQYRFNPENNDWIDLHANLWQTQSELKTNNSGGMPYFPVGVIGRSSLIDSDEYKQGMINQYADKFPEVANCTDAQISSLDTNTLCGQLAMLYGSNTNRKSDSFMHSYNNRVGVSLSNTSAINNKLDMTVAANWQKEKLWSDDIIPTVEAISFIALPRKGRREAWDVSATFDYQPTDKWNIQTGLTYNGYWAFDDLINERRKKGMSANVIEQITGYNLVYYQKANQAVQDKLAEYNNGDISGIDYEDFLTSQYPNATLSIPSTHGKDTKAIENGEEGVAYVQEQYIWKADSNGKFSEDNNPFFNGEAKSNGWLRPAKIAELSPNNFKGAGQAVPIKKNIAIGDPYKSAKKHRAWAVIPSIASSYEITDSARLYARYAQSARMPSMYESTLGFSLYDSSSNERQIKPEEGRNFEVGYVQNLTPWFNDANVADIKFAYYNSRINNIIDRTDDFAPKNFDHQTIEGLELQSRYDEGDWFGDLSVGYTLKHEVCDGEYAIAQDPYYGQVPECVKHGFQFGYLQNMGQPDIQADLTLGTRTLDENLTIGSRLHYHSGADKDVNSKNYGYSNEGTIIFNTPIDWSDVLTLDAFINYKINDKITLELSGTNLTDQYYIDPLSRTLMPAPGRAVAVKAQMKF